MSKRLYMYGLGEEFETGNELRDGICFLLSAYVIGRTKSHII